MTTSTRGRLSVPVLVAAARNLLVTGGPAAVAIRELAREIGVAPSALYKHVSNRSELITLLVAELYDELATACEAARDAQPVEHHRARMAAAAEAVRAWAAAHPAEFDLLFGYPLPEYQAPDDGPTARAGMRFGAVFLAIFGAAQEADRLRLPLLDDLPPALTEQVMRRADAPGADALRPETVFLATMSYQRMLGLVIVETTGQLTWALTDPGSLTRMQLAQLADDLFTPGP